MRDPDAQCLVVRNIVATALKGEPGQNPVMLFSPPPSCVESTRRSLLCCVHPIPDPRALERPSNFHHSRIFKAHELIYEGTIET